LFLKCYLERKGEISDLNNKSMSEKIHLNEGETKVESLGKKKNQSKKEVSQSSVQQVAININLDKEGKIEIKRNQKEGEKAEKEKKTEESKKKKDTEESKNKTKEEKEDKNSKESLPPKEEGKKEKESGKIEEKVLSVNEALENLYKAKEEYLRQYELYLDFSYQLKKEKDEKKRLEMESVCKERELWLKNAKTMYYRSLDEYKVAVHFDLISKKKNYIREQLLNRKKDIIENRIRAHNAQLKDEEIEKLVKEEIEKEVEIIFASEKKEIQKDLIGVIAYDVLNKEESLNEEIRNILKKEKEKHANFFGKIWERFKAMSYGKKALLGAAIAGVGGGILGVAGGAGFAALGIGATLFGKRFFGGFVVGGGVKGIADKLIGRKERKELEKETRERVEAISKEIADLINNPEKEPRDYEQWIKLADYLDKRLGEVLHERDLIREKNDKKRRMWILIASLIGGLAANYDNIYALLKGHHVPPSPTPPSKTPPHVVATTTSSPEIPPTPLPKPNLTIWPEILKRMPTIGVPVGKEGFWGAASILKSQLGIPDADFAKAWANAIVTDPISKTVFKLPQAHWVLPLKPDQQAILSYNPVKKLFEATIAPKVQIGGAEELINAYKALGKEIPLVVTQSILKGLGQN
jgi:hypothetical protein